MPLGLSDNLFQRIVSALSLLPIVLGAIYLGGWWFYILVAAAGYLMITEWHLMLGNTQRPYIWGSCLSLLILPLPILVFNWGEDTSSIWIMCFLTLFTFTLFVLRPNKLIQGGVSSSLKASISGISYIGLALVSLIWLRTLDESGLLLVWLFFAVWAMDVGGYFAGKGIGGPKLAPSISPKKTWAGLIGGMVLSALVSLAISLLFNWGPPAYISIAGAAVALVAQIGDLYESAIKRCMNIKDSGAIIPGHGGILDRVDGIIFAAPFTAIIITIAMLYGAVQ